MIFAAVMFIALCAYAYVETHWEQILAEVAIRRMIRESYEDARHVCRNPIRCGTAGYHPGRRWEQ
jgi:hypothetical protein